MRCPVSRGAVAFAGLMAVLGLLPSGPTALAEILPTHGAFDGVYHRDRWGYGTLGFLQFPAAHQERMARYEGKHVRVELKRGHQETSPGPVIVDELGEVQELPGAMVVIGLRLVPPDPVAGEPFQAVCTITNTSSAAVSRNARSPGWVRMSWAVESRGSREATPVVERKEHSDLSTTAAAAFGFGPVELPAGASIAYPVEFEKGLPAGRCEFTALAMRVGGDAPEQSFSAVVLDVKEGPRTGAVPALKGSEALLRKGKDGEYEISLRVTPGTGGPRRVAGAGSGSSFAGRVRGFSRDGSPVAVEVVRDPVPGERWSLVPLPEEGRKVRFRVRPSSRFPEKGLDRLEVEVLGSEGIMRVVDPVVVGESPGPPQVPFGPSVQGVRLRGRAADGAVEADGELRIHLQALNETGRPVVWWQPHPARYESETVALEIDGRACRTANRQGKYIEGWAGGRNCSEPREWTVRIPAPPGLLPGKHVLRLTIRSVGGSYRNSLGKEVPVLAGDLQSNAIEFTVR
jgi:hypothetical protein